MANVQAALVDVDGTLLVSNDAHARAWQRAFARYGFEVSETRLRRLVGMGGDKILATIDASLSNEAEPGKSISASRPTTSIDRSPIPTCFTPR